MIPLMRPRPARLSEAVGALRAIEGSGIYSNFGPVNTRFEQDLTARLFDGVGGCMTVCNATIGLMLAIRFAMEGQSARRKYALMPSFTFAATAQAALWCGLTPLLCDIDPVTWAPDAAAEEQLLRQYSGQIAVVLPYATFGADLDLARYEAIQTRRNIPVVIDAAASLGTRSADGVGFGTGFSGVVVFSMHATKSFSTGEGGVVYSADPAVMERLRMMANFGFGQPRMATMPGLNGKLSEVGALLAQLRLEDYGDVIAARSSLMQRYRDNLPDLVFQGGASAPGGRAVQAHQFAPALLPRAMAPMRSEVQAALKAQGIGAAAYFSPHLAEQSYFAGNSKSGPLDVTANISSRILSLPLYDDMSLADVNQVTDCLSAVLRTLGQARPNEADRIEPGRVFSPATLPGRRQAASAAATSPWTGPPPGAVPQGAVSQGAAALAMHSHHA